MEATRRGYSKATRSRCTFLLGILSAISLLGLAACGGAEAPTPAPTASSTPRPTATPKVAATVGASGEPVMAASDIADFTLENLTVKVGTTLTWTNQDNVGHTVTAGTPGNLTGEFRSATLTRSSTFSQTFDEVGTFQYFCEIHPSSMKATITVTP